MTTIHTILDDLARTATDTRDKGDKFERLMAAYLRTEPVDHDQFGVVWLWSDWPIAPITRAVLPGTWLGAWAECKKGGDCDEYN